MIASGPHTMEGSPYRPQPRMEHMPKTIDATALPEVGSVWLWKDGATVRPHSGHLDPIATPVRL